MKSEFKIKKHVLLRYQGQNSDIIIPEHVTRIESLAFYGNQNVRSVVFPDSVRTISGEAFLECRNLERTELPEHLETIGNQAFYHCNLKRIVIPDSVVFLGERAFYCPELTSVSWYGIEVTDRIILTKYFEHLKNLKAFLDHPENEEFQKKVNLPFLFRIDTEHFKIVLESGKIFDQQHMKFFIRYANSRHFYEKQILLMEYQHRHFNSAGIGEDLKL